MHNHQDFKSFLQIIERYITSPDGDRVVKYLTPPELHDQIDLNIKDEGEGMHALARYARQYLDLSVRTGSKQFLNQLYQGFNLPAFLGDITAIASNTSMYTYEVAPVATEIEREMIRLMNSYVGYDNGDGIFVTGGSNANLVAMFSARNRFFPNSRFEGVPKNKTLTAFVSDQSHYSFENNANVLGIGSRAVIKVKADSNGRMIPEELEIEIARSKVRGETPFFVAATCATTLLGAFDPIDELAEVCQRHNVWLHADGSFGGSLILSQKHKHLFRGIEKTDSFAWNPHKLMNIPLICSAILVKKMGTLQQSITDINTDYIFHDIDQVEDLGKKSIQCGRRVDAVKLWFAWKYYGKQGYAKRMENLMALAEYAERIVLNTSHLELLAPRQSVAVCFRYIPPKGADTNDFNLKIRETLRKSGRSLVNYGYMGADLAIRLIIANGDMERTDVDTFFSNFMQAAKEVEGELNG